MGIFIHLYSKKAKMNPDIQNYNNAQEHEYQVVCNKLAEIILKNMPEAENKIWHAHPVWFLNGNPIVGYDKLKNGLRLMFCSGVTFEEPNLKPGSGKFKDASITYTTITQVNTEDVERWLQKSKEIQWDYKNIVKRKGVLERLK
ncbi:MAG: hypothetical protein RL705_930 [Bacteroidota bacterium]|jgi:hypothetical protein